MATVLVVARGRFSSVEEAAAAPRWYTSPHLQHQALGLASVFAFLVSWELLSRGGLLDQRFIAAPSEIVAQVFEDLATGALPRELGVTLWRLMLGYTIGVVAGLAVGFAMGLSAYARAALNPLLAATYPVPKLALLPLVMMLFGLGEESKIAMVAISAFYLLPFNIMTAIHNIEAIYVDVARNLGVGRWLFLRTVALPYALPMLFAGLRLAWAISLIVIIATEMLAAKNGLGFMIWRASQVFDTKLMFSGFVTIGALGYCSHVILELATRLALPWQRDK